MSISKYHIYLSALGIIKTNPSWSTGLVWGKMGLSNAKIDIHTPIDNSFLASVQLASEAEYAMVVQNAQLAFPNWRMLPAPKRGEIIRQIGNEFRENKQALGELITIETGKTIQESLGEVQEIIDICDFAVGLSRQLYGLTMHSERVGHRMYEQYHPLGIVGIISAFNFPVAVWAWNAMLAAVCGNVCIWKPSEKTPLTAIACQNLLADVLKANKIPEGVFNLVIGNAEIGSRMANDFRIPLISATGSTEMGKKVGEAVGKRLGKSILELGGNNALIITPNADIKMAVRAVLFGAVGTAGQRCTSVRRLIIHTKVYDKVKNMLLEAYSRLRIGNPMDKNTLIGPLVDQAAVNRFLEVVQKAQKEGGVLLTGGKKFDQSMPEMGNYVCPTIIEAENHFETVQEETFAPILYMIRYKGKIEDAIALQNNVKQGLSSSIFTNSIIESEIFLSHLGSDCGIANVNIATSGAEIGGAFGGEKETGGGRESGSDAWKAYMRRQTNTINFSGKTELAQGLQFDV
ncbi:MAG: aldehyde dehydrogenase family protein [Cytophagales bacterium]